MNPDTLTDRELLAELAKIGNHLECASALGLDCGTETCGKARLEAIADEIAARLLK